jgi:small conductance mechanosensitive channel
LIRPPHNSDETASDWVRINGHAVFRVAAPKDELSSRIRDIQQHLTDANQDLLRHPELAIQVDIRGTEKLPILYVNDHYIMTVTSLDAQLDFSTTNTHAETLKTQIKDALERSRQEHQPDFLIRQAQIAAGIFVGTLVLLLSVQDQKRRKQRSQHQIESRQAADPSASTASERRSPNQLTTQLSQQRQKNMGAIQITLLSLAQISIGVGSGLVILGLFPYTRWLQVIGIGFLGSYFSIGLVMLGSYLGIRLSYVLTDWLISLIMQGSMLTLSPDERLQLRASTLSRVTKGIVTVLIISIGAIAILISLGIDVGPLIAGAGLIGVAISLASQNLIKDAINGFLILVEDQYAVGDVIAVGSVFGRVENMTLRITQLRDPEERLITIPNSEIKIVSNLSSRHAQADVKIPVAYSADIDKALTIVREVSLNMSQDAFWQGRILADPLILGLDEFTERGMVIRVWIKTPPMMQWDVGREYRRRIKVAFDAAGIPLAVAQEAIWLQNGKVLLAGAPPVPSESVPPPPFNPNPS